MTRILLMLQAQNWEGAFPCLQSAMEMAADPDRLSVGLSLSEPPTEEELFQLRIMSNRILLLPSADIWQVIEEAWQGESHVLAAHPAMRFSRHWDKTLLHCLGWCQRSVGFNCLLTGLLPREQDPVDAVCAVAAAGIDRRMNISFERGTPLRYAVHPVPGAFINRDFCFGPAAFFRHAAGLAMPLFLAAGMDKWEIFTLNRPVIHILWEDELPGDDLKPWIGSDAMLRFETRNRFKVQERELNPRLRTGIMTQDLTFETKVPAMVRLQEAFRTIDSHTNSLSPLCVTCWLTVPGYKLDEERMVCFRRLSGLKNMLLICYTDPPNAHTLSLNHSWVTEYQQHYGLQVPKEAMRKDLKNYARLCKPFLLARTRQRELKYSHYIWLDFDYLRYPVYTNSAMDWETVCRDRIMMALVDGRPDPSMISIPEDRLEPLCRQIDALLHYDLTLGRELPPQQALWVRLMTDHPDWFEVATLPGRHELLALTMTARGEEYFTK